MTYSFFSRLMLALILLSVTVVLAACGSTAPAEVWKYQTILIAPDASLMQRCPVEPPPNPVAYQAANLSDREGLDVKAYNKQTTNISLCNGSIDRMSDWVAQQKALYPDALVNASAPVAASSP